MSIESWLSFVVFFTLLGLPIGPNAVHTMGVSIAYGLPRGFLAPLGIGIAAVLHALVATLGFGAILLASAELYTALRWAGAAYLMWLGIQLWRGNGGFAPHGSDATGGGRQLVLRAVLVSLSNPKAVLSYMAVYPQFVDLGSPLTPQLLVMIPTSTAIVLLIYSGWAILAWPMRRWFESPHRLRLFNRFAAVFYMGTASALAFGRRG